MNRFLSYFVFILQTVRTLVFFKCRFKKCGKGVLFGNQNMIVGGKCIEIGERCVFGNNLRLEAVSDWCGEKFSPLISFGDGVMINQNFHCTCASSIRIGAGTAVTANCGIFDIIHPYDDINVNPALAQIRTKPIRIGSDCLIGMNSVILPGTELGNHCVVGANSTVSGIFPDYCVIAGSPAKIIKQYNLELNKWIKV